MVETTDAGHLIRFWPTALPLVLGMLAFGAKLESGAAASSSFGSYAVLWRGYDPLDVGRWFVYHLGDFAVYLAIVPVAVAPIVLWALARDGRAGSRPAGAFVALFAAANVTGLLVVAAFASSPWGFDRLHDRYGFYLLPLWLIGLVVWLDSGLPRPLIESTIGVVGALALALILPFGQLANEAGIDTVPGALWERVEAELAGPGPASGRLALGIFVVGLLAATFLLPRRVARVALPVAVAATFAGMSYFAWERMVGAPEDLVFAGGLERAWIDERVAKDATVTKLYADTPCGSALERHAIYLTEFFNSTVDRAAYVTGSTPDGLPIERVDVSSSGVLRTAQAKPLVADYVFTQPGIRLAGRRVAEGTAARLVLWHVGGPRAGRRREIERAAARGGVPLDWLAHAPEVAARVERDQELLPRTVDLELVRSREKRLDRLERAGEEILPDLSDVRVLDDHVAADGHEARVLGQLGLDVRLRVVGVQDHERALPLRARTDIGHDVRVDRGAAAEVGDPRMRRVVVADRLDVDRDDLSRTEQVADRGEEERAPPRYVPVSTTSSGRVSAMISW